MEENQENILKGKEKHKQKKKKIETKLEK